MLLLIIDILILFIIIYFVTTCPCNTDTFKNYFEPFQDPVIDSNYQTSDNKITTSNDITTNIASISNSTQLSNSLNNEPINPKIPEVEQNIESSDINKNYKQYSNDILSNLKKNNHLLSDRYRKQTIYYYDTDLQNDLFKNDLLNELENNLDNDFDNYNSIEINTDNDIDIDSKILNKSNRCQKLFKDSKTIASRFNKQSLFNEYNSELNFYENLKTPWWYENNLDN